MRCGALLAPSLIISQKVTSNSSADVVFVQQHAKCEAILVNFVAVLIKTDLHIKLEIRSVERGICPTADSIMMDAVVLCSCHNCWLIYSRQHCC